MLPGSINYLLEFIQNNMDNKPFVYFSNGVLKYKKKKKINSFNNFDSFVKNLHYWSSWSTGMAFWKDDFLSIKEKNIDDFNELFPHTDILFSQRKKNSYIIDDNVLLEEMSVNQRKKGKYDLFYAFAVEFVLIIMKLYTDGDISYKTFNYVKKKNKSFVRTLYYDFVLFKKPSSYCCDTYKKNIKIFYSRVSFILEIPFMLCNRSIKRLCRCFKRKKR